MRKKLFENLNDLNKLSIAVDKAFKFRDFQFIPYLRFKSDWRVQIIPPFGGAVARFYVSKGDKEVSVYLDRFDMLGYEGEPYWEAYQIKGGGDDVDVDVDVDPVRFKMAEANELISHIEEILDQ